MVEQQYVKQRGACAAIAVAHLAQDLLIQDITTPWHINRINHHRARLRTLQWTRELSLN